MSRVKERNGIKKNCIPQKSIFTLEVLLIALLRAQAKGARAINYENFECGGAREGGRESKHSELGD
jgi:hypothetical protein